VASNDRLDNCSNRPNQDVTIRPVSTRTSPANCRTHSSTNSASRSKCGDGSAVARSFSGGLVEVYLGFFYSKDVPGISWWFFAAGARTTSALRDRARQRGNLVIDNAFATHPGFNI
jgi:hypothetical protein